jgi:hypothetical protein
VREVWRTTNDDVRTTPRDMYDIVGHEPVTPLDEIQDAFTLADTRPADEQQPDTVHVCQ